MSQAFADRGYGQKVLPPSTTQPSDPFEVLRDWWYKGKPLPDPGSREVLAMTAYFAEHPDDPHAMHWMAVAATKHLVKLNRSNEELLKSAADKGDPTAMARVGRAYLQGESVPADRDKGLTLLYKSLDLGEPDAALELGRAFLGGPDADWAKAEKYLRQTIGMGHIRAHYFLCELFQKRGAYHEALTELKAGADAGDEASMVTLAEVYQSGKLGAGVHPDEAVRLLHKGAQRGHPAMQRELVKCIMAGYGGLTRNEKNFSVARMLIEKAAAAGDTEAMRIFGKACLSGELDILYNPTRGIDLLRQASTRKDPAATYDLALLYVEGLEIPRDLGPATVLMKAAAAGGYKPAEQYLHRLAAKPAPATQPSSAGQPSADEVAVPFSNSPVL